LRYYDPEAGRFVSRDPLGMWGDPGQRGNAQNYCGNNPVNRVDPLGLSDSAASSAHYAAMQDAALAGLAANPAAPGQKGPTPVQQHYLTMLGNANAGLGNPSGGFNPLEDNPSNWTRLAGVLKIGGSVGEALIALGLLAAPEPTGGTKVAALGLGIHAADQAGRGGYEAVTGQEGMGTVQILTGSGGAELAVDLIVGAGSFVLSVRNAWNAIRAGDEALAAAGAADEAAALAAPFGEATGHIVGPGARATVHGVREGRLLVTIQKVQNEVTESGVQLGSSMCGFSLRSGIRRAARDANVQRVLIRVAGLTDEGAEFLDRALRSGQLTRVGEGLFEAVIP